MQVTVQALVSIQVDIKTERNDTVSAIAGEAKRQGAEKFKQALHGLAANISDVDVTSINLKV